MPNPGDRVNLVTKKETLKGILLPSADPSLVFVKLDTGYNVGFPKKEVTITALKSEESKRKAERKDKNGRKDKESSSKSLFKPSTTPSATLSKNKELPPITILHTGGTIASKADYRTGGVVTAFSPSDLITLFPELQHIANIESELVAQMWSDDLRFAHFTLIAKKIEEQVKKGTAGIVLGMGTDNLAVAAAALSFIIEKTPIPIILVGSQRSSDRGSSDAGMNLMCAASFIAKTDFAGVAICMHETEQDTTCAILPGCKTYKLHSSRRDAFKAINAKPIARVDYKSKTTTFLTKEYPRRSAEKLVLKPKMEEKVGLLKVHVNMFPEQFEFFKEQKYKGLIIEGTGLGHTPGQAPNPLCEIHKKMYPAIKKVIDSGCIVVMATQCLFGGVNMQVYDKGRDLLNLGIIPGGDMLANTALVKLSWLLANYPRKEVEKLITQNLRGELSERIEYEEQFVPV